MVRKKQKKAAPQRGVGVSNETRPPRRPVTPSRGTRRLLFGLLLLGLIAVAGWQITLSLRAWSLEQEVQQALERRDFSTARERLQGYLRIRPADAEALLLAAQA